MVDQSESSTNHCYLTDLTPFVSIPANVKSADLARLCFEQGLTVSQISERCELSKPAVIQRLHAAGVRRGAGNAGRSPDNYHGQRVVDGKLVADRREMTVVRLILHLRTRECSWSEVLQELEAHGHQPRRARQWQTTTVRGIHKRWEGKL